MRQELQVKSIIKMMVMLIYIVILLKIFISLYGFEFLFSVLLFQPERLHLPFILVDVF